MTRRVVVTGLGLVTPVGNTVEDTWTALMSGRYPGRFGPQALAPSNLRAMPLGTITLASALKSLGYATGQFGKNHLGDRDEYLPTNHGFDSLQKRFQYPCKADQASKSEAALINPSHTPHALSQSQRDRRRVHLAAVRTCECAILRVR